MTFLLIFMNIQLGSFSYRTRSSINLSYGITGSVKKVSQLQFGPEISSFKTFFVIFHIFIKSNEYANKII